MQAKALVDTGNGILIEEGVGEHIKGEKHLEFNLLREYVPPCIEHEQIRRDPTEKEKLEEGGMAFLDDELCDELSYHADCFPNVERKDEDLFMESDIK
ncbi:hypothetical protein DCAR_0727527 [Daucus carota subsp. sativus]|uniref:Uncharacterized protein n=1 Tax=Daucus carota subsp. sativus TaxID=79200 RepID=A0A164SZU2_DAUCS|nr:hypothetical protein DCAR_0727527 [Daucus carota subsp. sativus]